MLKRHIYQITDIRHQYRFFCSEANRILQWKNQNFIEKPVEKVAKTLVDWVYTTGFTKLDYTKGILIKGKVGRGKTFLMECLAEFVKIDNIMFIHDNKNKTMLFTIVTARQISNEYETGGSSVINKYSNLPCLVIDDIGTEGDSSYFGNKCNVVDLIIENRAFKNALTFGTTNLEKLSDNYDDRTISRMHTLFNVLVLDHDIDFRKEG